MRSSKTLWMPLLALGLVVGTIGTAGCSSGLTSLQMRQVRTHRDLADLKLSKGETNFAIRQYRAALEINPRDAESEFGLGEAFRRRGDLDSAASHFTLAFKIDPDHQDAIFNLGVVYIQQERWDDAIALNTGLADDPTFLRPERALVNRGWALYKSGQLEGAKQDFEEALAGNRADSHSHLNLGIVLYEQGDLVNAVLHFETTLRLIERRRNTLNGLAAQTRFHLAQAHVKLGQRAKAIKQLQLASQGGNGEWAEKSREYLTVLQ